jgi:hypothetical protein
MLNIPGTVLITKKEVILHEEPKNKELDNSWLYYSRVSVSLPPLTPLLLLEIKHNPESSRFGRNRPKRGSKRQKILRFLYDNKYYTCEMSDGQINKFFGLLNRYEKIKKALEYKQQAQQESLENGKGK